MSRLAVRRIDKSFAAWDGVLTLIQTSFAYMDDRIDPPSSANSLTAQALRQKAESEIGFVVLRDQTLAGCMFCRPESDCLYIGKLAVRPTMQRHGIGGRLLTAAEDVARQMALPTLRLETRIELVENHTTFAAWGFVKTAENAHPGFTRTTSIEMQKRLML